MAVIATGERARAGARSVWGVAVAAAAGLLFLFWLDMVTPENVPLGVVFLALVVASALYLDGRRLAIVVGLAIALRTTLALVGDIPVALAALESVSFVVGAAAMSLLRQNGAAPNVEQNLPAVQEAASIADPRILTAGLTPRELEVLEMALRGLTAVQIAERLHISKRTVETHLERAYGKVGVHSKRELIALRFDQSQPARVG